MSTRPIAIEPDCVECRDAWLAKDERRWRAYLDDEDRLVFYCPSCAEREFGEHGRAALDSEKVLVLTAPPARADTEDLLLAFRRDDAVPPSSGETES